MKNIFLHYAPKDQYIADEISKFLDKTGYTAVDTRSYPPNLEMTISEKVIDCVEKTEATIIIFSQNLDDSTISRLATQVILNACQYNHKTIIPITIDNYLLSLPFTSLQAIELSKDKIAEGNFDQIISALAVKETENYEAKKEEAADKEIKKEVVKRISDSTELKKVIVGLRVREWFNKIVAMLCYLIGIAGIFIGAKLAYSSINTVPNNKDSYYYIYIGAKNLAMMGLLILCSRYTFNIGKIYMEEGVKQADRLHAINYGKFFLDSFQEKLSFGEMKELFKDWNMDNKPSPLNNLDPLAENQNIANANGNSGGGIADQVGKVVDLVSNLKK